MFETLVYFLDNGTPQFVVFLRRLLLFTDMVYNYECNIIIIINVIIIIIIAVIIIIIIINYNIIFNNNN